MAANYRCYYTGKLELPESYEELRLKYGDEKGCPIDEEKYDVFFCPIEAVASGDAPVTTSLEEASLERLLVVVPHEDFHEHRQIRRLPTSLGEAATTLVGFLTAAEFALQRFGPDSATSRNLSNEAGLYLRKSAIVNAYFDRLSELYAQARSGKVAQNEALARKAELFSEMDRDCRSITPDPWSFNKCLSANKNAGLAFERTYTKHYPLLWDLYVAEGSDLLTFIETVKSLRRRFGSSEDKLVRDLRDRIGRSRQQSSPGYPR